MRSIGAWAAFFGAIALIMVVAAVTPSSLSSAERPIPLIIPVSGKPQPSIVVDDEIEPGAKADLCLITVRNIGKGAARDFRLSWLQYGMQKPGKPDDDSQSDEDKPTPGVPMISFKPASYTIEPGKTAVIRIAVPKIPDSTLDKPGLIQYHYSYMDADGLKQEVGDGHIPGWKSAN